MKNIENSSIERQPCRRTQEWYSHSQSTYIILFTNWKQCRWQMAVLLATILSSFLLLARPPFSPDRRWYSFVRVLLLGTQIDMINKDEQWSLDGGRNRNHTKEFRRILIGFVLLLFVRCERMHLSQWNAIWKIGKHISATMAYFSLFDWRKKKRNMSLGYFTA